MRDLALRGLPEDPGYENNGEGGLNCLSELNNISHPRTGRRRQKNFPGERVSRKSVKTLKELHCEQ